MAQTKTQRGKQADRERRGLRARSEDPATSKLPDPASVMTERTHAEGCPMDEDRLEIMIANRPRKTDENGDLVARARKVVVVRCIECGGDRVVADDELDDELVRHLRPGDPA